MHRAHLLVLDAGVTVDLVVEDLAVLDLVLASLARPSLEGAGVYVHLRDDEAVAEGLLPRTLAEHAVLALQRLLDLVW